MRLLLAPLLAALAAAGPAPLAPAIDRIELGLSGFASASIEVSRQGGGRYHMSGGGRGAFALAPAEFDRLRERLEPFRGQAVPTSATSARQLLEAACPRGVPYATDRGAIYIRWRGPATDRHFRFSLGCDAGRNSARNRALMEIVYSLPVPLAR